MDNKVTTVQQASQSAIATLTESSSVCQGYLLELRKAQVKLSNGGFKSVKAVFITLSTAK